MDSELMTVSTKPVARRRVHSAEFKAMIVARCERGDESLASIALSHQLNATMVRKWVRDHQRGAHGAGKASFVPVTVAEGLTTPGGVIEITLGHVEVRAHGAVDPQLMHAVLTALR